jgi:RNA polymerase sigma-70 factor (ECF subfamily)
MDDLIDRWAAGDEPAAEELYRKYFARVMEFMECRGVRACDAEDLAQEALIAGLDGLKRGTRPEKLTHWLFGIARNFSRHRTRLRLLEGDFEREDPDQRTARSVLIRREMRELLDHTMKSLSKGEREILELSHRAGLSRKEIGERLELPSDAVHARFKRAHERLRNALSEHFTTVVASRLETAPVALAEIEALRPGFRSAVTAVHLEELSPDQAALRLGVPLATLRARLRSAYEMLGHEEAPDFARAREEYRRRQRP